MAIIPKGQEPENIKKRINTLFPKLDEAYPDKVIVSLRRDHKKWDETASEISRQLGYESKNDFLIAYGYKIVTSAGGRPKTTDAAAVIEELKKRYPNGSPFSKMCELQDANPDLASKFRTLSNQANELFGMTLGKYLESIGIIDKDGRHQKSDEEIEAIKARNVQKLTEISEVLKSRYPDSKKIPSTIRQLADENPDLPISSLNAIVQSVHGIETTASNYLLSIGLLPAKQNPEELVAGIVSELFSRYPVPKDAARTLSQLKANNPDLPWNKLGEALKSISCMMTPEEYISSLGFINPRAGKKPLPDEGTIDFEGRVFVYTNNGDWESECYYDEVEAIVNRYGGTYKNNLTRDTDYLIVDKKDGSHTVKYTTVMYRIKDGEPMRILSFEEFSHLAMCYEFNDRPVIVEGYLLKRCHSSDECVITPDGISVVGTHAFLYCKAKRIIISEGVVEIQTEAFKDCPNLESVILPSTLEVIGERAFSKCLKLKEIRYEN